jgi:hypothetical protein
MRIRISSGVIVLTSWGSSEACDENGGEQATRPARRTVQKSFAIDKASGTSIVMLKHELFWLKIIKNYKS